MGVQSATTEFDGTDDGIVCSLGACGATWGPGTMVALLRPVSPGAGTRVIFSCGNDGLTWWLSSNGDVLNIWNGSTFVSYPDAFLVSGAWWFIAVTKPAGSSGVRFHVFNFTDTWQHSAASSAIGAATPATDVRLGNSFTGTANWNGDIALIAYLTSELTDYQLEDLLPDPFTIDLDRLMQHKPNGVWLLGTERVVDLTGRGANERARVGTRRGFPTTNENTPKIVRRRIALIPRRGSAAAGASQRFMWLP